MTIADKNTKDLSNEEGAVVSTIIEEDNPQIEELALAGVHLGHRASKLHPRMKPFVTGLRNTTHVIDLAATAQYLTVALAYIAQLQKEGKDLMIVGTKPPLRLLVKQTAEELGLPFVIERWIGGTFTNFGVIRLRVKYYLDLRHKRVSGELDKYTKKEMAQFEKEIADLTKKFEGLAKMEKLPEAIFVCDVVHDSLAIKEAKVKGIKTIGLIDTNADPLCVDYPIPANDDAISSVRYMLDKVKETILENKVNNQ
ncbi:MAG: 30S ribosomal protein S2 [Patescibacteria group bacterium]